MGLRSFRDKARHAHHFLLPEARRRRIQSSEKLQDGSFRQGRNNGWSEALPPP